MASLAGLPAGAGTLDTLRLLFGNHPDFEQSLGCAELLSAPEQYTQEVAAFPITCQQMGSCSIHTYTDIVSHQILDKAGHPVLVSPDYLVLHKFIDALMIRVEMASSKVLAGTPISTALSQVNMNEIRIGIGFDTVPVIIHAHGAIPASVWHSNKSLESFLGSGEFAKVLLSTPEFVRELNNFNVARQSLPADTAEYLGHMYGIGGFSLEVAKQSSESAHAVKIYGTAYDRLRNVCLKIIKDAIGAAGTETFEIDGKTYDPLSFAKFFVKPEKIEITSIRKFIPHLIDGFDEDEEKFKDEYYLYNIFDDQEDVSYADLEDRMITSIDAGRPLAIGVSWRDEAEVKKGIMDWPADKEVPALKLGDDGDWHSTQVVGYDLDSKGRVRFWKIKNSWGARRGDRGYFHMTPRYFRGFVESVDFFARRN